MALYGGQEKCIQGLLMRPKERSHLGDLVLDGRTVLRWIFKKWVGEGRYGLD